MNTPKTIDKTWNGSTCFPVGACVGGVVQKGVGRGRSDVVLLMVPGMEMGRVVSFSVIVVGFVIVDVSVMVVVVWMNEVSKIETVFSTVSVM